MTNVALGSSGSGTGIIGIFNISRRPLSELIPLSKFPGVDTRPHVIRSHGSGRVTAPLLSADPAALVHVSLGIRGYDILSSYPLQTVGSDSAQIQIANLGLLGKMSGCAAIVGNKIAMLENGMVVVDTKLKALGVLGSSTSPHFLISNLNII